MKDNDILREKLGQLEAGLAPGLDDGEGPAGPLKPHVATGPKPVLKTKKKVSKKNQAIVGARVNVYWVAMKEWFNGTI